MRDRFAEMRHLLPTSYIEFIESRDGWEGDLGEELGWVRLLPKSEIQPFWDIYELDEYLGDLSERWFPFGTDGGGEMLCFDLSSGSDRVSWLPFIGYVTQDVFPQSYNFADLSRAIEEVN